MSAAPVKCVYWATSVSGGLVTSRIEQCTDWGYDYNRELAVLAENNGFDYALGQVRYMASYGAEFQHREYPHPPLRGVHPRPAPDLDRGPHRTRRRLPPVARLLTQTHAPQHPRTPAPGDLPGRQTNRLRRRRAAGRLFPLGFLHYHEEVECFGRRVLPLVRGPAAQLPDAGAEPESVPAHA